MIVCAHGNVAEYCEVHGMTIGMRWDGDLREYDGYCRVLVTDSKMSEGEYYFLKGVMLAKGVELVSVNHNDDPIMLHYLGFDEMQRRNRVSRHPFGFYSVDGEMRIDPRKMVVAKRIIALRDKGMTYREIREDTEVRHPDGRSLSLGTIQKIIKNRNKYGG